MPEVILSPKGLFVRKDDGKWKRAKKSIVVTYLRDLCKIEKDTTLLDIFNIVDQYKLLKSFVKQYSWCRQIDEFHAQAKEPMRNEEKIEDKLEYLEIYWDVELYNYKNKNDFNITVGLHGGNIKNENYSVSYTPMYDLADLPIKLDKKIELFEPYTKNKERNKIFEAEKEFTLQDVLDAIYWDISFMGGPQENKKFIEEMKQRKEDIDSGLVKMIPLEEVMKQLGIEDNEEKGNWKVKLSPEVADQLGYSKEKEE